MSKNNGSVLQDSDNGSGSSGAAIGGAVGGILFIIIIIIIVLVVIIYVRCILRNKMHLPKGNDKISYIVSYIHEND